MTDGARIVVVTTAEAKVLRELLRDGPDYATIARRLGYTSDASVKTHVKALLKKTHCRAAIALVVEVLREFVVCIEPVPNARKPRDMNYVTVEPPM